MTKYDKLKRKYDELIRASLEKNKRILIESFVEYYGEEFRNIIEKRYNEIIFVYYIDWDTVDLVINEFFPQINSTDKYTAFIDFNNAHKHDFLSKIFSKIKPKLPDNLIGVTKSSIINDDAIANWLFKVTKQHAPCSFNYGNAKNMNRLISFQILSLNTLTIIHEINHAITRDNIAYIVDNNVLVGAVFKTGLSMDVDEERIIEELLNEKSSKEIEKIFKSKGGDFSDFCLDIPLVYFYKYNLYLINEFYKQFKDYIKISRISDRKNELVARIGKNEYEEFVKLVNKYYIETEDFFKIESNKKEALPLIKILIEKMTLNVNNSLPNGEDKTTSYLKELEKLGYNLRILNTAPSEPQNTDFENNKGIQR